MNGTNSSAKHYDMVFCEEWSFSTAQAKIPVE